MKPLFALVAKQPVMKAYLFWLFGTPCLFLAAAWILACLRAWVML